MNELEEYKEHSKNCRCKMWCRVDYHSGFTSIHHKSCFNFDKSLECSIFQKRISDLEKENENLKTTLKEIKQCIPKIGEPTNYVSIDAYEKLKNQLESARIEITKAYEYLEATYDITWSHEPEYQIMKSFESFLKENPRGEK
jgi:hypothetical protein